MSEKLLTLKEACEILDLEPDEMLRLVDEGRIPCFRIGGEYMRFKRSQLEVINFKLDSQSGESRVPAEDQSPKKEKEDSLPFRSEKDSLKFEKKKGKGAIPFFADTPYTGIDRIKDFWHFNDVYIVSIIIIITVFFLVFR